MNGCLSVAALSVALTISTTMPSGAHGMGGMGGGSAGAHAAVGFGGHGVGFHHGFGFHHRFLPPTQLFHEPGFDFGAGFRSHGSRVVTGGYEDDDYASDDDYGSYSDEDIENLHFRAQEPFGPGDIGRETDREEPKAPYMPDRMGSWQGYRPED